MKTINLLWVDPFTDSLSEQKISARNWFLTAYSLAQIMTMLDEEIAGLRPGEGAGFDIIAFVQESDTSAAWILKTRGLSHGNQLLISGRMEFISD